MSLTTNRIAGYDIARILACVLIYLQHTPGSLTQVYGSELACLYVSSLTDSAIIIFFMISGAFLLGNGESARDFFRRRLSRILIPMAIFTAIYILQAVRQGAALYPLLAESPFEGAANGAYWFLYVLCGLYLATPILSRWLTAASSREVAFYLGLWLATTCFPFYDALFGYNPYRSEVFRLFAGYTGAYVAGFYIRRYIDPSSRLAMWLILIFGISALTVPFAEYCVGKGWYALWNGQFNCVAFAIALLLLTLRISGNRKSSPALALVANLTLGMYLFNTLINDYLIRHGLTSGFSLRTGYLLFFAVSTLSAFAICFILSRIPLLREAIGFTGQPRRA